MTEIRIIEQDPALPACCELVEAHWFEMGELYGDTGPCLFRPSDVYGPGAVFLAAYEGLNAIGCGALRQMVRDDVLSPGEAEVKRVYVRPSHRNRGIARQIMEALEALAPSMDYKVLTLETGSLQPFAVRLYRNMGYSDSDPFGEYIDDPRSVFLSKIL